MEIWKEEGADLDDYDFHPLVRNAILRRFRINVWEGFEFIPLGSGNIFWLNPNGETIKDSSGEELVGRIIIDRDINAAINIAAYNPYSYNAYVIDLQINRITNGESISKSQKHIKNKLMALFRNFYKILKYNDFRDDYRYPYSYLCLVRVMPPLHKKIATAIYNGLIYHINKPRTNAWKVKPFNEWINHVEHTLLNSSFKQKGIHNKSSKIFIEYISSAFDNPTRMANIMRDITLILRYLETKLIPESNKEDYGTVPIKSLMDIDKLNNPPINFEDFQNDQDMVGGIIEEPNENLESETVYTASETIAKEKIISSLDDTRKTIDELSKNLGNLNFHEPSSSALGHIINVLKNENAANKSEVFIDTIKNYVPKEWKKYLSKHESYFSNTNDKNTYKQIMKKLDHYSSAEFQTKLKNIFS